MPAQSNPSLAAIRRQLRVHASPEDAVFLQRFFKTGPGEYGEGDEFLGVRVPAARRVARECDGLPFDDLGRLLDSKFHEERLLALLALVRRFERGDATMRGRVFQFYLDHLSQVNNWDLVDSSAPNIVGGWLLDRPRALLDELADAQCLWSRRVAVLATLAFIRQGDFACTLRLCRRLLGDRHDLMHKACGWMLREVGKRNPSVLLEFLEAHAAGMPRTMLRYALERLPETQRREFMAR
jgi:3-methyladenine DNA glycosylase AlkD